MQKLSLTRVNQKLAQAKAVIDSADKAALTSIQLNSLQEAAAFHLMCGYQHYLREIAETYWLKNSADIRTEADLITAFETAKKHPVEAEELIALRNEENSWLGQIHSYYKSLWTVPVITLSDTQNDDLLIKAVTLESVFDIAEVDLTLIASWHSSFAALVMRQRETSAEF